MKSVNPATGETLREYQEHSEAEASEIVQAVAEEWRSWRVSSHERRRGALESLAATLLERESEYARLITLEMGKTIGEAHVEIQKCARICRFFGQHGEDMLADEQVNAEASRSVVAFEPLGPLLAIMPWNFPFWQVFRFAAPALMAGNACVLKHASNVSGCALAIEEAFRLSGLPENLLRVVLAPGRKAEALIAHPAVRGVAVTGSAEAGAAIAAVAGRHLKKTVLELGGSDPFIVLEDANVELCAAKAVRSRMKVAGQACIAAKRLIVHERVAERFIERFVALSQALRVGDPLEPNVDMGPLARADLVDKLEEQTQGSLALGACLVTGGRRLERPGFFFEPTLLTGANQTMPVFREEVFGPVAALATVRDEDEAVAVANQSEFGLGGSVWTRDPERGEALARRLEAGIVHVNGITRSDPRLPFGGIKRSGWGRELSWYGIREFVNVKSIMIA